MHDLFVHYQSNLKKKMIVKLYLETIWKGYNKGHNISNSLLLKFLSISLWYLYFYLPNWSNVKRLMHQNMHNTQYKMAGIKQGQSAIKIRSQMSNVNLKNIENRIYQRTHNLKKIKIKCRCNECSRFHWSKFNFSS